MEKLDSKKKVWIKPEVQVLNIKKDTFSGVSAGPEGAIKGGPPLPPGK